MKHTDAEIEEAARQYFRDHQVLPADVPGPL
jgi:hypothetical protein